ncbi:hypothetical protein LJC56_08610 [Christensenellaceae bacterium OttesenSCG-928-K19]|nr:hypothetical protein [Christensenellaceae bacterium OttesenSCG-928-K19]
MGLFKPAWQSDNEEKVLKAVANETDKRKLVEIALKAPLDNARVEAIKKINDQSVLFNIATSDYTTKLAEIRRYYDITS